MEADAVPMRAQAATNIVTREIMIFSIVLNQSTKQSVVDGNTIENYDAVVFGSGFGSLLGFSDLRIFAS
jgi:hypothetical protein